MNYIGSKTKLTNFISNSIQEFTNGEMGQICDLFAGTGTIGAEFKSKGYSVISNDIQYYSFVFNQYLIECNSQNTTFANLKVVLGLETIDEIFSYLNKLNGKEGFIYSNYCPSGLNNQEHNRTYFTDINGLKCDAIRDQIESWFKDNCINKHEYYYLLSCLLESIDKVANTTSVYAAYLKNFKKSSLQTVIIKPLPIIDSTQQNNVYQKDANDLVKEISPLIYYLDPPYNNRVYSDNYHILETIAKNDNPEIKGKTGLRSDNYKSNYSKKKNAEQSLIDLLYNVKSKYLFLSYNNEGIIHLDTIRKIMESKGHYELYQTEYKRYKADTKREYTSDTTIEYLHCLRLSQE
jgi:adenine-specific DNA-methyltransferase